MNATEIEYLSIYGEAPFFYMMGIQLMLAQGTKINYKSFTLCVNVDDPEMQQ